MAEGIWKSEFKAISQFFKKWLWNEKGKASYRNKTKQNKTKHTNRKLQSWYQ